MWESIGNILTSEAFLNNIPNVLLLILAVIISVKLGVIKVKTKHVQIGKMSDSDKERSILREQIDWVYTYIHGLEGKIRLVNNDLKYGGFFTKYILELAYDEVVKWITFNHISMDEGYITAKTKKLISLIYAQEVQPEFMTPEFKARMERWIKEVIEQLVEIRKMYS